MSKHLKSRGKSQADRLQNISPTVIARFGCHSNGFSPFNGMAKKAILFVVFRLFTKKLLLFQIGKCIIDFVINRARSHPERLYERAF